MPRQLARITNRNRPPVSPELERRPIRLVGDHLLRRDGWTYLLDPDVIDWDWTRLEEGVLNVSTQHQEDDNPVAIVESAFMGDDGQLYAQMAFARGDAAQQSLCSCWTTG